MNTQTALGIAAAYRTGETTPAEVVDAYLAAIAERSDTVGAFVTVTEEAARRAADLATTTLRSADPDTLPPLFGVPTALKDLNVTEGVRTTFGSAAFADFVPTVSDAPTRAVEAAGMISLGKTNTPEFGLPCYTEPDIAPPARTPYDLSRGAGGSSGGAATAVASGLVPVAQGSDGGGSIRIPASCCGLVGLKTGRGRVSAAPAYANVNGLTATGPLARTVRDAAALLDVLARPVTGDVLTAAPPPDGGTFLSWCDHDPGHLRVARFCEPVIGEARVDPQVLDAYEAMTVLLRDLGHTVVDIAPPMAHDAVSTFEVVWAVGAASAIVPPEAESSLTPLTRWLRERGDGVSGPEFAAALTAMNVAGAGTVRTVADYDLVLSPTLAALPAPVGSLRDDADPEADFTAQKAFTPYTAIWNVTGLPAISLPTAWSREGLPIGTMLAGRPGAEHVLLAVGAQVEARCGTPDNPWNRPEVTFG